MVRFKLDLKVLFQMRQSDFSFEKQYFRKSALKFQNFKLKNSKNFESLFDEDFDGQVQIPKFKLFRFYRNKV